MIMGLVFFQLLRFTRQVSSKGRFVSRPAQKCLIPDNFMNYSKKEVFDWARNTFDLNKNDAQAFRAANISADILLSTSVSELQSAGLSLGASVQLFRQVSFLKRPIQIRVETGKEEPAICILDDQSSLDKFLANTHAIGLYQALNHPASTAVNKFDSLIDGELYQLLFARYDPKNKTISEPSFA
jgi:hypothetical protein